MSAVTSLAVSFEKDMDVFQAGQTVRGQVDVTLKEDMEARGVNITLKGKAHCWWTIYTGNSSILYTGDQLYFDNTETLWGPGESQSGGHPVLKAGKHSFPFRYELPSTGLPTSFEGCHGGVRYYAKATIDRPSALNKTLKKYFTVLDMYDLNEDPEASTTASAEDSKTLGVWPFASDPIEVHVQTDRGAYCPGEMIRLSGVLKNGSGTDIRETTVQLRQKVTFIADQPMKMKRSDRSTLSEIKAVGCKGKESTDLSGITIQVPSIPPSSQRYCNVIDIVYKLKFIVNIPGPHKDLEVDLPITIGCIPLRSYYPLPPSFPSQAGEEPTATDPSVPPPPYYAVSIAGPMKIKDKDEKKGDKDDMGQKEFAPKYTYYDWSKHS